MMEKPINQSRARVLQVQDDYLVCLISGYLHVRFIISVMTCKTCFLVLCGDSWQGNMCWSLQGDVLRCVWIVKGEWCFYAVGAETVLEERGWISPDIPRMGLLDCMVVVLWIFFFFEESLLFSMMSVLIYIFCQQLARASFSSSSLSLSCCLLVSWQAVTWHTLCCGFGLHGTR